jgi:hypothetical protein
LNESNPKKLLRQKQFLAERKTVKSTHTGFSRSPLPPCLLFVYVFLKVFLKVFFSGSFTSLALGRGSHSDFFRSDAAIFRAGSSSICLANTREEKRTERFMSDH